MGRSLLLIATRHTLLQVAIGNGHRDVPERCQVAGKHRTTLCQTRAKSAESGADRPTAPAANNRCSVRLGTGDGVETGSAERVVGFRSNRHTPERASPWRRGGCTRLAIVAESQPSHQPAHVNWNVRCLLFSAPAAIARTVSQTSMHPRLYAL